MSVSLWEKCLNSLESEFPSQQFNTWIRPLQAEAADGKLVLYAPNRFVLDWIAERFLTRINELVKQFSDNQPPPVSLEIGSKRSNSEESVAGTASPFKSASKAPAARTAAAAETPMTYQSNLNLNFTFDNFVEGKSNQLAKAACLQVSENPAGAYNPLFLYGGVGLGKTHLMHAIGNQIIRHNARAKVLYLHSERFVADMVKAL
ncbi:MAG: chromosomal replication initiator protein DnaA, partial [Gammaproteobacteria bacterium]